MAKINLQYDTKDKSLKADMDGKKLSNVHHISTYHNGGGKHSMQIMSNTPNDDESMTEQHCIYANENFDTVDYDDLSEKLKKQLKVQ